MYICLSMCICNSYIIYICFSFIIYYWFHIYIILLHLKTDIQFVTPGPSGQDQEQDSCHNKYCSHIPDIY